MWEALSKYQPYADADGHGESWRVMCEQRTHKVAFAAEVAADVHSAYAGWKAARAATEAEAIRAKMTVAATRAAYWSNRAIESIEAAIKERT